MAFELVERSLAEAIDEGRPDGPRWVVRRRNEFETGCIWTRRALVPVPLFVPILPPGELYVRDFNAYLPDKHAFLMRPSITAAVEQHLAALADAAAGDGVLVFGGAANYFHWLIDFLPKLWVHVRDPSLGGLPLLVNADFSRVQREALDFAAGALGLASPSVLAGGQFGFVGIHDAYIPTRVTRFAAVGFWRRVLERTVHERPGPPRRRLLVTRAGTNRRELRGEADLAARLARHGVETVDPARLSFVKQVETFADARVIVGVHGAGLTNAVFAPRSATLIELRGPPHTTAYWAIAQLRGQRYVEIPVVAETEGPRNEAHRSVVLSADGEAMLLRAIAEAG